jgi:competence protein ComEC
MIERVSLFSKKQDIFISLVLSFFILLISLLLEYKNYYEFNRFDSITQEVTVLKQYTKSKNSRTYQVLKLRSDDGVTFYTTAKKSLQDIKNKKIKVLIWPKELTFLKYLSSFYANSKIITIYEHPSLKQELNEYISNVHEDKSIANIYHALYSATPLEREAQSIFSNLGISHLLAISGFHLGVLSALLYFFIRPIYSFFQDRFFPYTNAKRDTFFIVASILLAYTLFLDTPPSLIRAFGMLLVGFFLYDRGIKIISMQTLFITIMLLLAFFPRLFFSLGFWLSSAGVFYIFLFFIYFKALSKVWQFLLLPIWVYLLMLPYSLAIFENFSAYHPLSIIWTTLFTLFYPLSILAHIVGYGAIFDDSLLWLLDLGREGNKIELDVYTFLLYILLSFTAIFYKKVMWSLVLFACAIFIYAIYHIA